MKAPTLHFHRGLATAVLVATLMGGLIFAGGWLLRAQLRNAERDLRARRTELAKLHAQRSAPGLDDEEALAARTSRTVEQLGQKAAEWSSTLPGATDDPLLALAETSARLRQLASEAHVTLAPGERFGFSEFSRRVSGEENPRAVAYQRLFVEEMLAKCFRAGIAELLEVKRSPAAGADRFEPQVVPAHARSDFLTGAVLRVTILTDTDSLRRLLNTLAEPAARCLVLAADVHAPTAAAAIGPRRLRVALTIERLEIVGDFAVRSPATARDEALTSAAPPWPANARSRSLFGDFAVQPIGPDHVPTAVRRSFPFRLARVEPIPARIELLGGCELRGEFRAMLRDRESGAVFVLARGQGCPQAAVELLEFCAATPDKPVRALLRDGRTGAEIHLGRNSATTPAAWQAVLSPVDPGSRVPPRLVSVGHSVPGDDGAYRVSAISADPPAVELCAITPTTPPTANVRLEIKP